MNCRLRVHRNAYKDSVRLLEATRILREGPGVAWGTAFMATSANRATLAAEGFAPELPEAGANDLILAVRAQSEDAAEEALAAAARLLFESRSAEETTATAGAADLRSALQARPQASIAAISVPGAFGALEAHKALAAGLDVFLFSDNVPVEDEIALKRRGRELGRLVMGPGAGTAMLGGAGLGFANRLRPGPVGIVAASGTGAQEVACLLDRWGIGVSHIIGVGGRDVSDDVGGLGAQMAIEALDADMATRAILLVSKPPSPAVAARLLRLAGKPMVAALVGLREPLDGVPSHVTVCDTLEQGARQMLRLLGGEPPDPAGRLTQELAAALAGLAPDRRRLVGLYSGGTLCHEAMTIAARRIGPIYSNIPLDACWSAELAGPDAHICLDLGEEAYTRGRPHPMIDAGARIGPLLEQARDRHVVAVLLDVVLGDGAHPDPAGALAPAASQVVKSGAAVIVHVVGTSRDPQDIAAQCARFRAAGCLIAASGARAALAGVALVLRNPAIAGAALPPDFPSP